MNIEFYNVDDPSLFTIEQADFRRQWIEEYAGAFPYRCLPLKIANENGWMLKCPANFNATYVTDDVDQESVKIDFENTQDEILFKNKIVSHFGRGVITLILPFVVKTPEPWCVWVRGLPNYYKDNVCFLEGIIETFWSHMPFTYNIRLIKKEKKIQFKKDEPLMFITIANLKEIDNSIINFKNIEENLEFMNDYKKWSTSRSIFLKNESLNKNKEDWQKHYFKGVNVEKLQKNENHKTKINLNVKKYKDERKLY